MRIERQRAKNTFFGRVKIVFSKNPRIISLLLFLLVLSTFSAYKAGFFSKIIGFKNHYVKIARNYIKSFTVIPENIIIDVKYKDFQKLAYKRKVALSKWVLISAPDDFVPGVIRYNDKSFKIKLRLKGDMSDHWEGEKWSFRVKLKGKKTLFGMKKFSIQHPRTRNFIYEWILHKVLEREGLISLRYKFVNVIVNGKEKGIYALEEHFDKRLLEHNKRKEGPIIRFDEDLLWKNKAHYGDFNTRMGFFVSDITAHKLKRTLRTPLLKKEYLRAVSLLEKVRLGKIKFSDAFDVKKTARCFAIFDLLGGQHGILWNNAKFYYNPITALLEPIAFDANTGRNIRNLIGEEFSLYKANNPKEFFKRQAWIWSDFKFFKEYAAQLERISKPAYLKSLLSDIREELDDNLSIIHREFPHFFFSQDIFYSNQKYIRNTINPLKGLQAYFHNVGKDYVELELANIQYMPLQVTSVSIGSKTLLSDKDIIISPKIRYTPLAYKNIRFKFPSKDFVWSKEKLADIKVNYKVLGTSRDREEKVVSWSHMGNGEFTSGFVRSKPNFYTFKFIKVDEQKKEVLIKQGKWTINRDLIIPKGYKVVCNKGTTLDLKNSATIISYSALEFKGSEEEPIWVQSSDSTGQGIAVIEAGQSSLHYTKFKQLSNPSKADWELSGAVTFYNSPVNFYQCRFLNNNSEDSLNLVHSKFKIERTIFNQTYSDALDSDFSEGEILNSMFIKSGNDAVDLSGSSVKMQNIFIGGFGDKGLSAGEKSIVTVNNIKIKGGEIAVASKDESSIKMYNLSVKNCKVGFTVFQKKSEFGPASVSVSEFREAEGINVMYLVEDGSAMSIDGKNVKSNQKNVKSILYGAEYGKSSK